MMREIKMDEKTGKKIIELMEELLEEAKAIREKIEDM